MKLTQRIVDLQRDAGLFRSYIIFIEENGEIKEKEVWVEEISYYGIKYREQPFGGSLKNFSPLIFCSWENVKEIVKLKK